MFRLDAVLQTKLQPPRLPRRQLPRPRLDALLGAALDYRVTIVRAGTGYGKSTALARLAERQAPLYWYSVGEGDADPQLFLAHLYAAFRRGLPVLPDPPPALGPEDGKVHAVVDALLNALSTLVVDPSLLVIDDYHLAASPEVDALLDRFLLYVPPDLHVIVSTRYAPHWEHLLGWQARGEVHQVTREMLAFSRNEIETLYRETYGLALAPRDVGLVYERTEGWPIALQLVWQGMRSNLGTPVSILLREPDESRAPEVQLEASGSYSLDLLFAFLAQEVLGQQRPDLQRFLIETSVLNELTPDACDAVRAAEDSRALLAEVRSRDLFVAALGEGHDRYQYLFHDFLRGHARMLDPEGVLARHMRAGAYYDRTGNLEEAIYHLLRAEAFDAAAERIETHGDALVRAGRLDTVDGWIDALPHSAVAAHPPLLFLLGDLARLRSRFDEALAWYQQAERAWRAAYDTAGISRALRGQGLIYLDTVRPAQAEHLLEEALRLSDGVDDRLARARLLELLAENKLNMGKAEDAESLRQEAQRLRQEGPSEDALSVRVKLRTGQLDKARTILESWAEEERGRLHPPRSFRETLLILSLVYALQGEGSKAQRAAEDGIALGAQLQSPFVSAVGQMRLGHAYQVLGDPAAALDHYDTAVSLGDQLAVQRTRVEARWGMTRAHGLHGDVAAAERDAAEGIEIGRQAGDPWVVALVQTALGATYVEAGRGDEAIGTLSEALDTFRACGDTFGRAADRLWLALAHWRLGQRERAAAHLEQALTLAEAEKYETLVTRRTLLGWQDPRIIVPLLLQEQKQGPRAAYAAGLLADMGLGAVTVHPGYQLRVQTLGAFRAWRGAVEVTAREWQRRKARQLFQLLLTRRGRLLQRDEILDLLWADETPEAAMRDFKVALNALNKALEPNRASDDPPAFVVREEAAYGLRPGADLWLDADEFSSLVACAETSAGDQAIAFYRRALPLYGDDYLANDARYDEWASAERERLLGQYLRGADRLAQELYTRGEHDECIAWCERLLARDSYWEHAYRLLMRAYAGRGDRVQARRVFERCATLLRKDLEVEPSPATVQTYREMIENHR